MSPELRQYVLKKANDAVDVENLRSRGRGMRGTEQVVQSPRAPPRATTRRKAAVAVGMGSRHDEM